MRRKTVDVSAASEIPDAFVITTDPSLPGLRVRRKSSGTIAFSIDLHALQSGTVHLIYPKDSQSTFLFQTTMP